MRNLILTFVCLSFATSSYAAFDSIFIKNNTAVSKPALECYEVGLENKLLNMCNLYCGPAACDTPYPQVPRASCDAYKAKYEHYARMRGSAIQIPCEVYKSKPYRPEHRHNHHHHNHHHDNDQKCEYHCDGSHH